MLDLSRVDADRTECELKPEDPSAIIDAAVRFMLPRARRKEITLSNQTPPGLPVIMADSRRLRQVLLNLIGNALHAVDSDGVVVIEAGTQSGSNASPGGVWITVADNGIGMTTTQIERAFEPFVQVHSNLKKCQAGAGLGLTIVKQFVECHGGDVRIDSEPDVGTTVRVTLPIGSPSQPPLEQSASS